MARKKLSSGDATDKEETTMTTKCAVGAKEQSVSPKKIKLEDLPVYDPGAIEDTNENFVDNVTDTDDYGDL